MERINQDFSVPAGDDFDVVFQLDADAGFTDLTGATIEWQAFEQQYGCPVPDVAALITKSTSDNSISIINSPEPPQFIVHLVGADTIGLLRNYYHEASIVAADSTKTTVERGIMCVTMTENR